MKAPNNTQAISKKLLLRARLWLLTGKDGVSGVGGASHKHVLGSHPAAIIVLNYKSILN